MRLVIASALFLAVPGLVFAQGERGTITGAVADPGGAVVVSAAIQAKHDQPFNLTRAPSYTMPRLNINKIASWALRDWQINGLLAWGAEMPNPVSTNAAATQQRNASGVPTGGFGQINTAGIGPTTSVKVPW